MTFTKIDTYFSALGVNLGIVLAAIAEACKIVWQSNLWKTAVGIYTALMDLTRDFCANLGKPLAQRFSGEALFPWGVSSRQSS